MDFRDTPQEATFRAECRHFPTPGPSGRAGTFETWRRAWGDAEGLRRAKEFQRQKAGAGLAAITWPKEYGGRAESPIMQAIYNQEEVASFVPRGYFEIGLGMCIPTMMAYATEAQKQRYVARAIAGRRGDLRCQLFSEPAAGSDLAGLRTRSVRDGDGWIINGQKIWTSGAHFADYGIIVTRSDPKAPKHRGLTFFFLDMTSPGIEVRRIKQISGASNFNEVYFTDVRVPDGQRLGAVGQGWGVAITTLMNERLAVGDVRGPDFDEIFHLARTIELEDGPAIANAAVRERLADWYARQQGLRWTKFRSDDGALPGPEPGPGGVDRQDRERRKAAGDCVVCAGSGQLDMGGAVMEPALAPTRAAFQEALLYAPGARIAGGTDEILKNILAERVLGLPADVRIDKEMPFDDLPKTGGER